MTRWTPWLFAVALAAASPAAAQGSGSPTLDGIRARGTLACGTSGIVAGFSLPDSQGVMQGLDADTCRAVAAAVLGDAGKLRFVPLTPTARFTALQSGEIDLLVRTTTWTLGREANLGLLFAGVNFYDGAGFLVKAGSGVKSAMELGGATVCVQPASSTELALGDYFRRNGLTFTPVLIQDANEVQGAFIAGRCDAYSSDASTLASFRYQQGGRAGDYTILPEIISKEPLGLMVRKGDDKFFDAVRWIFFSLLQAEESGVTKANMEEMAASANPDMRRLLGREGNLGKSLGLDNGFAAAAVRAVGNYGEIFDRTAGRLGIPRGINNLWSKGGLHYPPPLR